GQSVPRLKKLSQLKSMKARTTIKPLQPWVGSDGLQVNGVPVGAGVTTAVGVMVGATVAVAVIVGAVVPVGAGEVAVGVATAGVVVMVGATTVAVAVTTPGVAVGVAT